MIKTLLYYYLALLTFIAIILMCASIILIPLYMTLRDYSWWWTSPFQRAHEIS